MHVIHVLKIKFLHEILTSFRLSLHHVQTFTGISIGFNMFKLTRVFAKKPASIEN